MEDAQLAKDSAINNPSGRSSADQRSVERDSSKERSQDKDSSGRGAMGRSTGQSGVQKGTSDKIPGGKIVSGALDELKKVVHPTRQEALQATVVTLIFMAFFGIILGLLDWALRAVIWQLL